MQGLIVTAGFMWKTLRILGFPVDVQEVCVFTAPLFSAFCSLATYGFVKEVKGKVIDFYELRIIYNSSVANRLLTQGVDVIYLGCKKFFTYTVCAYRVI